ncbi:MAG: ABC transporter ATP-binding protein [Lachnospiraceae bacterium]|nr:ABC transporter ATP-binding protein [Lachnospiraceae bacterium]
MGKISHYAERIKEGRIKEIIKELKWVYGYGKKHVFAIALYTALGMSGSLAFLWNSLVSRDLVDMITGHKTGDLIKTFFLMIGIQLFNTALTQVSGYISVKLSQKVESEIKADLYDKIIKCDWETLSSFHSGEITARWGGGSATIASGLLSTVPNTLIGLVRFGIAFWAVAKNDWTFVFFALGSIPISIYMSKFSIGILQKTNLRMMEISADMSSYSYEAFSNIQTIKAFDLIGNYTKKFKTLQAEYVNARLKHQRISIVNAMIMTLVSMLVSYSTYGWGIYKVWTGAITYGSMTMFLSLSGSLTGSTQSLISVIPSTLSIVNAATRIREITDLPKEDYSQYDEVAEFFDRHKYDGVGLCIRNASFTYMNGTEVFKDVSLDAHPHEAIAIIGPSGEGKTTMLRLILAIINAKSGHAYICYGDNTPESGAEMMNLTASTRQLFSYVPQGNSMMSGTIASNMRVVKEDATDEEIIEALKLACAWKFVERLPEGINSEIGEKGAGFSEGQAQRLSIARSLLRKSPILLLDEATSALDPATEKQVLQNILADDYPRTTIVTTHRPTVLSSCVRVYRIHDGSCNILTPEEIEEFGKGNL